MHSVVGRLATLLFDLALWLTTTGVVVCRRKHASLSRCGRVTAKHQVVSSKDATARARYLRFLNSSALLVLHEVVLSRWMRSNRLPIGCCRLASRGCIVTSDRGWVLLTSATSLYVRLAVTLVNRALTASNGAFLGDKTAAHSPTSTELPRSLLLVTRLWLSRVHLIEWAHRPTRFLLLWVRTEHAVEVLRGRARSRALIWWTLDYSFFIRKLTTATRLSSVARTTSRLGQELVAFLKPVRIYRLRVWKVTFFDASLLLVWAWFFGCRVICLSISIIHCIMTIIKHILNMLWMILWGIMVEFLLMW